MNALAVIFWGVCNGQQTAVKEGTAKVEYDTQKRERDEQQVVPSRNGLKECL